MHPLDLAALTPAGYSLHNILDHALANTTAHEAIEWLHASRCAMVWETLSR